MEKNIRNLILLSLLVLPLSQLSISIFGAPIYLPEIPIGISMILYLMGLKAGKVVFYPVPKEFSFGSTFLLLGAVFSAISSGASLQELGALKSWVFFPLLAAFLVFQAFRKESYRRGALMIWFLSVASTAIISFFPVPFVHETYDGRLASFFPSPNHLAFFLEPGILIGAYFLLRRAKVFRYQDLFFLIGTAFIISSIFRTESRGALIAVLSGIAMLFSGKFFSRKIITRSISLLIPVISIFFISFLLGLDWERLGSGEIRTSLASRVMIWNASASMLREHPLFGIGLRNFEGEYLFLQAKFPPYLEWAVPHPHNIVLALWLQTGILGLLGFAVMIGSSVHSLWKEGFEDEKGKIPMEKVLFLSYLSAFLIHGLVDTPFFRNDLSFQFLVILAFIQASGKIGIVSHKRNRE